MSAWPDKYVIGLTGNIATGKSVVRKMLEHLGAYGIDADALAHRVISINGPGYSPVIESFGKWILAPDQQIDRAKLAKLVFSDSQALTLLESIIHPLVDKSIGILIGFSQQKVIVLEAIKLIEGGLFRKCDSLWVTQSSRTTQLSRLVNKRKVSKQAAILRVDSQTPQSMKIKAADVVINNEDSFDDTWKQVLSAYRKVFPKTETGPETIKTVETGEFEVLRAKPQQAEIIAEFINNHVDSSKSVTRENIMEAFGEKAFLLLSKSKNIVGLLGWQVENLVARVDDIYIDHDVPLTKALQALTSVVESSSKALQCEAALVFSSTIQANQLDVWRNLEYQPTKVEELTVRAWQEAASESITPGSIMYFKLLRKDRVLRPI